jgi:hypothetical protein
MSRIVVQMSVSLDGFFEGPDADISWGLVDDEVHTDVNEFLAGMGAFLMGRVNYQMMDAFWPTADQDPESTEPMRSSRASGGRPPRSCTRGRSRGWGTTRPSFARWCRTRSGS